MRITLLPEDFESNGERLFWQYAKPRDCPLHRALRRYLNSEEFVVLFDRVQNNDGVILFEFSELDWNRSIAKNVINCYKQDPKLKKATYYVSVIKHNNL
jgi:hypothetical protein